MCARAEAASEKTGESVQHEFTWLLKQRDETQGNLSHKFVNFTCGRCKKQAEVCAGRCARERNPKPSTFRRGPPQAIGHVVNGDVNHQVAHSVQNQ